MGIELKCNNGGDKDADVNRESGSLQDSKLKWNVGNEMLGEGNLSGKLNWMDLLNNKQFQSHLKNGEHVKVYRKRKGIKQFRRLFLAQEMRDECDCDRNQRRGSFPSKNVVGESSDRAAIWCIRFSKDGMFMATAGRDEVLRIWKVISSPGERLDFSSNEGAYLESTTKTISQLNGQLAQYGIDSDVESDGSDSMIAENIPTMQNFARTGTFNAASRKECLTTTYAPVFHPRPYRTFKEHTDDILDVDWSKNSFILTGSMDKMVKLWHCDRATSLQTFTHPDFVTGVRFHPRDDRFFLSACLDQKCRLWSILEKDVSFEYDCGDLITSMDTSYDGKYTLIGTFNGYVHLLTTKGLELKFCFNILDKNPSTQPIIPDELRNQDKHGNLRHGPKITGVEFLRKEKDATGSDEMNNWFLVSSNDSRIRIYNMNYLLVQTLKGHSNKHSQISSHSLVTKNGNLFVLSGSEDHWVYCWQVNSKDESKEKNSSTIRSRSSSFKAFHFRSNENSPTRNPPERPHHHLIPGASALKIPHPRKLTPSSLHLQASTNSDYIGFHAHHHPVTCAMQVPPSTARTISLSNDVICELTMQFWETDADISSSHGPSSTFKKGKDKKHQLIVEGSPCDRALKPSAGTSCTPTMAQFVGGIIVTADTSGLIRVYRSDISSNVRKKVLQKLHDLQSTLNTSDNASIQTSKTPEPSTPLLSTLNNPAILNPKSNAIMVCNVCGGTRFSAGENHFCLDCGALYTTFR